MNPVEALIASAGSWIGTNTLQDPNTGKPEESPSKVTITPMLGDRFVRIDYTWGYQGKPQEGSLLLGFDPKSNETSGHWIDSWHMGRKVLACIGSGIADPFISVTGSYPAPTGPDWGWRIEIATNPLRIKHTNIEPNGQQDLAVEAVYSRG